VPGTCHTGSARLASLTAFDGEITAGVHYSFVSVVEADDVRRVSFLTANFHDHPVPV
jgi:hypothetical protein